MQVYTMAQVELMACDVPLVVYGYKGKEKKRTKKDVDDWVERWKAKKAKRDAGGRKFNLNDFLRTGELK